MQIIIHRVGCTNQQEIRNNKIKDAFPFGKASFIIALMGVIIPLLGGFAVAAYFNRPGMLEPAANVNVILQNVFIGVILTATSVSISVETLKEMGKLNTKAGNAILGAAIIDDILGIVALTVITSLADSSVNVVMVFIKIIGFFIFVGVGGYLLHILFQKWVKGYERDLQRFVILAFVICLLFSYCAEEFFGVADITGAFFAGLIITKQPIRLILQDDLEFYPISFYHLYFLQILGYR